jgi:putative phosphoribosyl transferase
MWEHEMRALRFRDRAEAGRKLAAKLMPYAQHADVLVLGLPRGGVPVAYEVAKALQAPLDVLLVRKLGVPGQEELAMGALASGGVRVLNEEVVRALAIPEEVIDAVTAREQQELLRREQLYRGERPTPELRGRTVLLVDDGIATGATMRAATLVVRSQQPARLIIAIPVAPDLVCEALRAEVDEVVCLLTPEFFLGVGVWYEHFPQITDEHVRALLARGRPLSAAES